MFQYFVPSWSFASTLCLRKTHLGWRNVQRFNPLQTCLINYSKIMCHPPFNIHTCMYIPRPILFSLLTQHTLQPQLKSPSVNGSSTAPSPVQSIIAAHISSETSSSSTSTPSPLAAEFTPQHPSTIIGSRGFGTPVSSGSLNPQAQLFMNGFPSPTIPSSSWSVKPSS